MEGERSITLPQRLSLATYLKDDFLHEGLRSRRLDDGCGLEGEHETWGGYTHATVDLTVHVHRDGHLTAEGHHTE